MKKINSKIGFSLIEAVLYLAIAGIILTAVISLHLTIGASSTKLGANIDVSRNRRVALSAIDYLVANSDGLLRDHNGDCSDFDASPPVLALHFSNDTNLPATCVGSGGGVKISVSDNRVIMTCMIGATNNGQYDACNATSTGVFYLTDKTVRVLNSDIAFSTSTATSSANGFMSVITNLSVVSSQDGNNNFNATSTATSTVVLRNQKPTGLVAWWKFDDASASAANDYTPDSAHDLTCSGTPTASAAIHSGTSGSFDFNSSESDYCYISDTSDLNFDGSFTLASWVKMDYGSDADYVLAEKEDSSNNKGYSWIISKQGATVGRVWLRIYNSQTSADVGDTSSGVVADATVYHVATVFDADKDQATTYVYQKDSGGINTSTDSSLPTLVNTTGNFEVGRNSYFDGTISDLRVYNRALTNSEIWALQSAE